MFDYLHQDPKERLPSPRYDTGPYQSALGHLSVGFGNDELLGRESTFQSQQQDRSSSGGRASNTDSLLYQNALNHSSSLHSKSRDLGSTLSLQSKARVKLAQLQLHKSHDSPQLSEYKSQLKYFRRASLFAVNDGHGR